MAEFFNRQWRLPNNENKNKQSNYSIDKAVQGDYISAPLTIDEFSSATMSIWFKTSTSQNNKYFLSFPEDHGVNGFDLLFVTSGIRSYLDIQSTLTSTFTYNDGNWHHVIVSYSGTNHKMYIDGVLTASNTASGTIKNAEGNFYIGGLSSQFPNYRAYLIDLDQACVFDYALSDGGVSVGQTATGQIATLYGGGSAMGNPMALSSKPIAYYPLGDQDAFNGASYLVPNSSLKDYVFDFTVNGQVISFGNDTSLKPSSNYTFSIWFKATSASYALFDTNSSTSSGVNALFTGANITYYHRTTGGTVTTIFPGFIEDDWQNFTVTWSASTGILRGFVNGKYSGEALSSVSDIVWGNDLRVGAYYNNFFYKGEQSNFVMWNDTLTDGFSGTPTFEDVAGGQVAEVYNNGSPQTTITGSPVGWWKLDASATYDSSTTTWTIPDSSSNSNDGTSSGMTQANLVQSDLSFTSGYSPYALQLDAGSSQYISTTASISGFTSFTISAWANAETLTTADTLVGQWRNGNTSNSAFLIYLVSNTLHFYIGSGSSAILAGGDTTLSTGQWYHFCATWDGTTTKLYINGVQESTTGSASSMNTTTVDLLIGAYNNSAGTGVETAKTWNGSISNASIWNASLTSSQITELYNSGVPSNLNNHSAYSNLVSWWQLGSNSSFNTNWTVLDEKGSNNGVSSNMTENDIVDGVGSYANGLSSGMGGDEVIGDAPYSTSNSLSVNMDVLDRVTDTPS